MLFALAASTYLIAILLETLVLAAMLRGPYRRYPMLFVYVAALWLANLVEAPLLCLGYLGDSGARAAYVRTYWLDERILMGLVFGAVISLLYRASERLPTRRILRSSLVAGASVFAGVTFWIHYDPALSPGEWITPWTGNLNFCAALLDLALWAILISPSRKEPQLLMLSGGLGIQFAGAAIGESIRNLALNRRSVTMAYAGSVIVAVTSILFLYVWWQTLRHKSRAAETISPGT